MGVKATTAEVIVGNPNGVWLARAVRTKPDKERWDRSNLEMVVSVPWRRNEDDPEMDGERQKSEVIVMDEDYKEKLEAEEHVPVPKRVYISRENLEEFGFTARCLGCMSAYGKLSKANRGGAKTGRLRRQPNGRKQTRQEDGNNVSMENRQLGWNRTHQLRIQVAVAT